jgi:hypothetical protein
MINLKRGLGALAVCTAVLGSGAAADEVIPVRTLSDTESTIFCVGTERSPSRFGGYEIKGNEGAVLIPARISKESGAQEYTITATSGDRSGTIQYTGGDEPLTVRLDDERSAGCNADLLMPVNDYLDSWAEAVRASENEVRRATGDDLITGELLESMIGENREIMAETFTAVGMTGIIPDDRFAAVSDVAATFIAEQEARERREKARQFIEDLAAAAEEYARQRDERRARLAEERRREEARRQAEEVKRQERERRDAIRQAAQYCFGALGSGCGRFEIGLEAMDVQLSTCHPNRYDSNHTCLVNAGSWTHDTCCAKNPDGFVCDGPGGNSTCAAEFWLGARRFISPFNWWRTDVDSRRADTDGQVDHDLFCAKKHTIVYRGDTNYCCKKKDVGLNIWDAATWALAHKAWAVTLPATRKCDAN